MMISVNEIVVVEGKYDVSTLSDILDATIIETRGFGVFKDKALCSMIKTLGRKRGMIILTDSDNAGFIIRNYLINIVGTEYVKNVYIPDIIGKEKRKKVSSKAGTLGVEGMRPEVLIEAFKNAKITTCEPTHKYLTKTDFYLLGLTGGSESSNRRNKIKLKLNLPKNLTANKLLDVLNIMLTKDEFIKIMEEL